MDYYKESLKMHEKHKGKMAVVSKVKVENKDDLSTAYTPGVAEPCRRIHENPEDVYRYTNKSNIVAVVSDGSAVLGLGNIGGPASIPVMDGKSLLFKEFAGIDAFPICLQTQDADEIVNIVKNISPTLGGINLEDISAPRCFEIEEKLQAAVDIPVFHDDQHGTAVVVSAAVINAAKLTGRELSHIKAVINGAGAAGTAIAKMLRNLGIEDIVACDSRGIITRERGDLNEAKRRLAEVTNREGVEGSLKDAVKGRDLFIGVSAAKVLTQDMVRTMNKDSIIFAMANPEPEILPDLALEGGAAVVGTGRSDFPNQINNVLIFPGLFKGALAARAKRITEEMKTAAAFALAGIIKEDELASDYIIPSAFYPGAADIVAEAVEKAWKEQEQK
ncbi:MAG TPA: NADP-dependent malic enzyme [Candidatus Copromorpha excrementigallinarum]|uniref:NADP-dependent malic enzyme n=1 Tax=Candidatus Allocopromorpha excrementigallinarum TaxID=2840742 RepID=A0A9D1L7N6_9FIRM|nr:NADP-dependent malic enzyme [Candidatus Copromorpha excrementigallinarum]